MNTQAGSRQFGIMALTSAVWIVIQQINAFLLALVLGSSDYTYTDEPATIVYLALTFQSCVLAVISLVFAALNFTKDTASRWLGVVALILNLLTITVSLMICIFSAIDTWG